MRAEVNTSLAEETLPLVDQFSVFDDKIFRWAGLDAFLAEDAGLSDSDTVLSGRERATEVDPLRHESQKLREWIEAFPSYFSLSKINANTLHRKLRVAFVLLHSLGAGLRISREIDKIVRHVEMRGVDHLIFEALEKVGEHTCAVSGVDILGAEDDQRFALKSPPVGGDKVLHNDRNAGAVDRITEADLILL